MSNLPNSSSETSDVQTPNSLHVIIPFVLPFLIFMIFTSLEPKWDEAGGPDSLNAFRWYPAVYLLKLAAVAACLLGFARIIRNYWRPISGWGIAAGAMGAVVWIGLAQISLEGLLSTVPKEAAVTGPESVSDSDRNSAPAVGTDASARPSKRSGSFVSLVRSWLPQSRSGYNPFQENPDNPLWAWTFFLVRMMGLVLIVPVMEEWFLRGFLFRFVCSDDWESASIGTVCPMVWVLSVLYPVFTHPEALAGVVWFVGMTVLAWKTKSLSDCVCAHAMTNAALGLWVLYSGQWNLL